MNQVVIVIPVYKKEPNAFEQISLIQCAKILGQYPVSFVAPRGLDTSMYHKIFSNSGSVTTQYFNSNYFKGLESYNNLLKTYLFYNEYSLYKYMLIYHTDAFVFRDELLQWCKYDLDYIGAPVFDIELVNGELFIGEINGVGNGGLSLRNIQSFLKVLKTVRRVYKIADFLKWYKKYNLKGKIFYFRTFMGNVFGINSCSHYLLNKSLINEDCFWGKQVPDAFNWFRVGTIKQAIQFSIELNPEQLLKMNHGQLPFGCHGWFRKETYSFWKPILLNCGFEKEIETAELSL